VDAYSGYGRTTYWLRLPNLFDQQPAQSAAHEPFDDVPLAVAE
jgi:hypothetical protein